MSPKRIRIILLLCLAALRGSAEDSPARQAAEARFDLYGTPSVASLDAGEPLEGLLSVSRPTWMKAADQARSYSLTFPVSPHDTNFVSFRFVPRASGRITLSLLGPYDRVQAGSDKVYKQEIVWDLIEATGASLVGESGALLQLPVTSWLRQRYDLGLNVTGGQAVVLRCAARAVSPDANPARPRQEKGVAQAPEGFLRGVRVLKGSELTRPHGKNADISLADLTAIQNEGFDHIRISVPWHEASRTNSGSSLDAAVMARLDLLIAWAAQAQLGVILGGQPYAELATNPANEIPRFAARWCALAAHYSNSPCRLAFELISPGGAKLPTPLLNRVYAETLRDLRPLVGKRWIFVSPGKGGRPEELAQLQLPDDDQIAVSIQNREPEFFTQQFALGLKAYGLDAVRFPGPPDQPLHSTSDGAQDFNTRDTVRRYLSSVASRNPSSPEIIRRWTEFAARWSRRAGHPIYHADMGCVATIEAGSRTRYYGAWRETLEKEKMAWGIADWRQDYRYWDASQQRPLPGMREALFPSRSAFIPVQNAASTTTVDDALAQLKALRKESSPASPDQPHVAPQAISEPVAAILAEVQERSEHNWRLTRWTLVTMLGISILLLIVSILRNRPAVEIVTTTRIMTRRGDMSPQEKEQTLHQVTALLKEKLVLHLLASRREGQLAQQQASEEVEEMTKRLERIRAPLQEKMHAYERRIAELEQDLERMGKQNRDLIRAKIEMTKQRITAPPRAIRPEELN